MLQAKQKGFTLLELLVVIVLLALLSVGALAVYDGITDKASATANANNLSTLNRALRQAAVANNGQYPDQWDTILDEDGNAPCWDGVKDPNNTDEGTLGCTAGEPILAATTARFLSKFKLNDALSNDDTTSVTGKVVQALERIGIRTVQTVEDETPISVASGLIFNEGGNPGVAEENTIKRTTGANAGKIRGVNFATVVSNSATESGGVLTGQGCTVEGQNLAQPIDGSTAVAASSLLNTVSDRLEEEECHLVLALGIGHDVAGQGGAGIVGLDTAGTYNSANVNAAYKYSRYIGLFHLGTAGASGDNEITAGDIRNKAVFVGVIDPEGRTIDEALSGAFVTSTN